MRRTPGAERTARITMVTIAMANEIETTRNSKVARLKGEDKSHRKLIADNLHRGLYLIIPPTFGSLAAAFRHGTFYRPPRSQLPSSPGALHHTDPKAGFRLNSSEKRSHHFQRCLLRSHSALSGVLRLGARDAVRPY